MLRPALPATLPLVRLSTRRSSCRSVRLSQRRRPADRRTVQSAWSAKSNYSSTLQVLPGADDRSRLRQRITLRRLPAMTNADRRRRYTAPRPPRCCCCCAVTASDPEAEQMQQLHTTEWCLVLSELLGATFTLNDVRLKEITQSFTAIATFVNSPLHTIQPCHTSAIHAHASGSVVIADTAYLKMLTLLLLLLLLFFNTLGSKEYYYYYYYCLLLLLITI